MVELHTLKNQRQFDHINKYGTRFFCKNFTIVLLREDAAHFLDDIEQTTQNKLAKTSSCHFTRLKLSNRKIQNSSNTKIILGLKISKKLSKLAVVRNKLRRQIKHLIHDFSKELKISPSQNLYLILIPKKNSPRAYFATLKEDLYHRLKKIILEPLENN